MKNERNKHQNVQMKMIMILMSIKKLSQLIKTHQINNISYIILRLPIETYSF
jgi:hypothetical protein